MGRTPAFDRWQQLVHRQPLMLVAVAAVSGVLVDARFGGLHPACGLIWLLLTMAAIASTLVGKPEVRRVAVVLVFLPLAAALHYFSNDRYQQADLLQRVRPTAAPTIMEGVIDVPPVLRRHPLANQPGRRGQSPWQTQLEVELTRLKIGRQLQPTDGRVLVSVDGRRDELRPGDSVRIYGTIQSFTPPTNPGERDLRSLYRQRHLHARVQVAASDQVILLGQQSGGLNRFIANIAASSRDLLLRHTSESTGPLAVALVIGQRDFVDRQTRDLLLVTGTAHLLSVSGLHLAIIVLLASCTAVVFGSHTLLRIGWVIGVCLLYTAITGGRPPVMRACVLVLIVMMAIWMKRPNQPINTLSLAALVLLAINPDYVFSIGVQLSFLAVGTLLLCGQPRGDVSPGVQQALEQEQQIDALIESSRWLPIIYVRRFARMVGQLAWFSACVTAISLPLVWQQFHVVSPVSVLTNVFLGPLLFLALAAGVATVVCGAVFDSLAILPGIVCDWALVAMHWVIESAAAIPWGHFWLPAPPTWWVIVFYIAIVASLLLPSGRAALVTRVSWIAVWSAIAIVLATSKPGLDDGSIEATFVDVGHGTCVILRFDEDDVWLYDCGRLGNDSGSSRDIDVSLWKLGVTHLSGVVLSHADADHFNGLPGVLRRFSVDRIITPPGMLDEPEPALQRVRQAIDDSGAAVSELAGGAEMTCSGHPVSVLHPPLQRVAGSDNANSLVLRIDCGGKVLLLPGDLEPPGTRLLVSVPRPPPGGLLMAPHHGSLRMDAASVLQWSRPRETIVSGGQRARQPEVTQMLSATGSGVYVTSKLGAIRTVIDRDGKIEVRSWSESPW